MRVSLASAMCSRTTIPTAPNVTRASSPTPAMTATSSSALIPRYVSVLFLIWEGALSFRPSLLHQMLRERLRQHLRWLQPAHRHWFQGMYRFYFLYEREHCLFDHPYCTKCYESVFANTCDDCNQLICIDSKVGFGITSYIRGSIIFWTTVPTAPNAKRVSSVTPATISTSWLALTPR